MLHRLQGILQGKRDELDTDAKRDRGFTLIELLVVITILGILAAVVVFSVAGIGNKGQAAACATDAVTIKTAEEANFAIKGTYVPIGAIGDTTTANTLIGNGLLSTVPTLHGVTINAGKYAITNSIIAPALTATCADS
jgi:prepilin-type N-terminal cleavage/methylation domain-containing protein